MRTYWLWWFILAVPIGFLIPETVALVRGRDQDTLSYAVWNLEHFRTGQPVADWNAFHFLFIGTFGLIALWLLGHFGWGKWR